MSFHVLLKFSVYSRILVHTAKIEIRQCLKDHEVVAYKKSKPTEIIKPSEPNRIVVVAYRRWSFTRGSNCRAFTRNVLVFWLDGRLRKVVTHIGWTVQYTHLNQHSELNCNTASAIAQIQTSSSCLSKT